MEQRKTEYNRISSCRSCGGKLVVTRTCHHCGETVVWYCASCFRMYDCVQLQLRLPTRARRRERVCVKHQADVPVACVRHQEAANNPDRESNAGGIIRTSLVILVTAESACILVAATVNLLMYEYSVMLAIPLAFLAGTLTVAVLTAYKSAKAMPVPE
jgi:predicted RNA-binding Zn-ribbon protein involved in translation (DUF1610 family)